MQIEVTEVVPGELDVTIAGASGCRVLIPAGVGLAGADDEELAVAVVRTLLADGRALPAVVDVSGVFASDPGMFDAVRRQLDAAQ